MALGASPRQAVKTVLKEGLVSAIRVLIGLALSKAASRSFGSLLFGGSSANASLYLAVIGVMAMAESFATSEMRGGVGDSRALVSSRS
jgi:hypothetical protein